MFDYIPRLYANYLAGCSLWGWRTLPRPPWQWDSWESGDTLLSSDSKRWNRWPWSKMQVVQVIGMSDATAHYLIWQYFGNQESILFCGNNGISVNSNVISFAVKICCSCSVLQYKVSLCSTYLKTWTPNIELLLFLRSPDLYAGKVRLIFLTS